MGCVFISHIEEDQSLALEIAAGLEAAGFQTWYYERDSEPGLSYLIQVHRAIERCVAVVLLISPGSIRSHQMTKEVVRANDLGKPFVPVRYKISHATFQEEQPEWNIAIGAAASIPIPEKGVSEILPRIVRGLEALTAREEDQDPVEPPIDQELADEEGTRETAGHSMTWVELARVWMKRHRFPVAGSAAAVLVLMYLAQFPDRPVSSESEPPSNVGSTTDTAPTTPSTTAPAASNVPSGAIEPERPPDLGAGNVAASPAITRPAPVRTAPAVEPSGTRTGRRATTPDVTPTAPSTTASQPDADNTVVDTPRRPATDDGAVVTRLPASPVNAPAAAPPAAALPPPNAAVVIPRTPTASALVNQTIEEYEKAAESLDLAEVRRVWPAAPDALRNSYRNLRSQTVNLDCGEPTITTDTAMVSCREQIRSVGAGGITLPVANNTAKFLLRRNGDAWQISSISRGN